MAEAKITITFTPREFDVAREALASEASRARQVATDRNTDIRIKTEERQRAAELAGLLDKLR